MNKVRIVKSGAEPVIIEKPGKHIRKFNIENTLSIQSPFTTEELAVMAGWSNKKWNEVFGLYLVNEFHGAGFNLADTLLVTGKPFFDYLHEQIKKEVK
ncbi:MAG: hypothetical protein WC516_08025 [Patescibacteria group bacterium]